ncbi:dehydrogenase [Rhodococcoides trifolii]|uniref:Dehydrogenase n=1 Tax=Rhodococcoides trifolii TaxID=908250 RepID=A0A917G750_9NOCA|nr:Gfo/Idh/MocA family oxidoreductase [Rhodococcus trifolii]GGG26388.1 dehydrogenase [Rhodococcus trifolii]
MKSPHHLRVALVGAGAAGQAHAFGFRNVSMAAGLDEVTIDLAVVVDPNLDLARKTAARYGYGAVTDDLDSVLADPTIDAISLALPNNLHTRILPAVLRSGKHVFAEKPIGTGSEEAEELVALATASVAVTGVGFSFRRLPGLAAVHDLVGEGRIGAVRSFTAWYNADYAALPDAPFSWRFAKDTAGAGALIDIGTHAIDAVQYVAGPIRRVLSSTLRTAITERPVPGTDGETAVVDTDDIALLTVELDNGAVGQIHVNRIAAGLPNSLGIEVHGATGHARFDSIAGGEFHVYTGGTGTLDGPRRVFTGPQHPYFTDVAAMPGGGVGTGYAEAFVAEIQHFVRCILTGTAMDTDFPSAYRVMLTVDAAQLSAVSGTAVDVDDVPSLRHQLRSGATPVPA